MSLYDLQGLKAENDSVALHSGYSVGCDYQSHVDTTCNSGWSLTCTPRR